ncbi:cathepsin O-like isoform X2 [Zootermopsis nevadensis]|uniref:cathepsin O-like isoform X2 n=1 Tax=Zootermopsis nevadensis TaxID=136037 RepID=UPI000B8E6455|nr:cathepsin O-like isoform X2 [Zootermopsis nevadensis]
MVENFVLEVFKAVSLRMAAFWVIVPCCLETVIFSNFFSFALFIVKESLKVIDELNQGRSTNHSALYGITRYSDLSKEEFLHLYLQPRLHDHLHLKKQKQIHNSQKYYFGLSKRALVDDLPMHVDWREKNVITEVRNQKTCGACWAFSTAATVEAMYAIRTGILHKFSIQELIDCAENGNSGCEGGDTCSLLEWLVDKKINIVLDNEYPLVWRTQTCKLKGSEHVIKIASNFSCEYLVGSEDEILKLLAHHGPVAVAVNALNWQNYLGGVIQFHCDGGPEHINHAVQIVGYNRSAPVPHYIVRNSWGAEFGHNGYLYIAIGSNLCGVATEVSTLDVL